MPEGHSVHRIALQFERDFVGHTAAVSSPQGRFAEGAAEIDGLRMLSSRAIGKQMFLELENDRWLRIHLGLYGAWEFFGTVSSINEESETYGSIGAPRRRRAVRMAENDTEKPSDFDTFPPEPVGQVRVRLVTDETVADLRGPTACEVIDSAQVALAIEKLGPDPADDSSKAAEDRFVKRIRTKPTPIGLLLMDQSVVAGIGNVYRAELLFRARLDPHTPGKAISVPRLRALWQDWVYLLDIGIRTGMMLTRDGLSPAEQKKAVRSRADRYWVYKREGLPCLVCGTNILLEEMGARKLYWCPKDQKLPRNVTR
ncbi:Fpg/Nei family DNA glycosylase [Subtercola boreus]|uniref:DNA-(apurinic or apyrimidinic site) lyase n=1 Tax=Subtercola boreus TaxID=120213 RepID=A0A3E0WE70_9MICO|nr:DNA-formamidopyrimidine glycosylase family protein [Subtercola boreus]RFA22158.1 DNA glycosylase [Subtercola boreus]RFA22338.1 DNA glycosylase [Subtercola boreus]RFA28200.1 DNA glycosylase [Subtercola boreus]